MLGLLNVLLGGALLVIGRKLFWLFVGAIGFVIGIEIATRLIHGSELLTIVAGLILGFVFAGLAVFVESVAIGIAGFLGGGYVLLALAKLLGFDSGIAAVIAFAVGGIIGIALIIALFDWALITISSLAGASMIVAGLGLRAGGAGLAYVGLVLAGVLIQGFALRRQRGLSDNAER